MPGQEGTHTFEVQMEHLATAWDNNLPVLATPIVLWWTEMVAMWLMDPTLEPGQMTVGAGHDQVRHLAPTGLGQHVTVRAECLKAKSRQVVFRVAAKDPAGPIYQGIHSRGVIDRERMLASLERRSWT